MRGTRWLLLVAIAAILTGLGITYKARKEILRSQAPARPEALPPNINSKSQGLCYTRTNSNQTLLEVCADDAKELKDSSSVDLRNVVLKLYNNSGDAYNLVKSAAATFYKEEGRLYSEGETEITLALPVQGQPKRPPIQIKSSGVNFDTSTGQAQTDRPTNFSFENGAGAASGAFYDPATHVLHLRNDVKLDWKPIGPHAKPMTIEAATLYYREAESEIWLKPWGRLTRGNTVVEGNDATVKLQQNADGHKSIQTIEATKAHGTDSYPKRKLDYSAEHLLVNFNDDGEVEKIAGSAGAHLTATSDSAETSIDAARVDLAFQPQDGEMVLATVNGEGNAAVTSKPLPVAGRPLGETHVLRSEKLDMTMRPGGREIERVVTQAPGTIEFLPNLPTHHRRTLTGRDMVIAYAPQNRIETFHAVGVRTETEPTAEEKKRNRVKSITTSKVMDARFDPKTGKMASIDQTGDFTYEEGERKARAAKATLDSDRERIILDTAARISDAAGSTSADRIEMDQRTGDFTALGRVNSSRLPDKDEKKNSQMLSGDDPLHAQARRMDSANRNRKLHYEGDVVMWQGANRIQADVVDLDREKKTLIADGRVVTNLWEQPKDPKKKAAAPILTEVRAPHLVYTEADRQAVYTGGAVLKRPSLEVNSRQIRAFLSGDSGDSRLEKAYADGGVRIFHSSPKGTSYTGTAERSEYYTDEQKVILLGGMPKMVDNKGTVAEGPEGLTYYANDGRLLNNGSASQPANTRLKRKN